MSFEGYLTQAELSEIRTALTDAGLVGMGEIQSMLMSIKKSYAGSIATNPAPNVYLWNVLQQFNTERNLRNGDVPLAQFLDSAINLAGPTQAADLLEEKLEKVAAGPPVAAAAAASDAASALAAAANAEVTPEAQTNAFDLTVAVSFLSNGIETSRSVAKILIHRHFAGQGEFGNGDTPVLTSGTAWFIASDLVITNHHVVNARRKEPVPEEDATPQDFKLQADSAVIQLDYLDRNKEPNELVLGRDCLEHSDQDLDFALFRIPDALEKRPPLKLRKRAMTKNPQQALGSRVNLLQHPNGKPMRLGFRNNFVVLGDNANLAYLTDTEIGSSGSPVCDDFWSVAALHRGSRKISDRNIEILGHKYRRENFGTPMVAIVEHLKANKPDLYSEIVGP
ncbi:trypsin-like peptidase domain-containing protein [Hyphomonas sp.]|uniref:trypsin-like peptidase domain-containing protein n=1 Tax=Hyphomonas sp. TaxID=87 RepID=UPI003299164A